MAMGIKQTHVAGSHVSLEFMAGLASRCGAPATVIEEIRTANTARHASEIINKHRINGFYNLMCQTVHEQMTSHSGPGLEIEVIMFEFDGQIAGRYP
jgi:Cobalamin biosynthesis protein CbiD